MPKYYLDKERTQQLIDFVKDQLAVKLESSDLNNYATKDDLQNVSVDLSDYASKDFVTSEIQKIPEPEKYDDTDIWNELETLEGAVTGVYHFKGSVDNLAALQEITNPAVGDTYNLADTGMNVAWTGSEWDQFGTVADLTGFVKEEDVVAITKSELNNLLFSGKTAVVSNTESFAAALFNNQNEVEITLNDDMAFENGFVVPADKTVTLELNGNDIDLTNSNISVQGSLVIKDGTITSSSRPFLVGNNGSLVVDGTDITSTKDSAIQVAGANANVVVNSGTVTAQEVPVLVMDGGSATINGGHLLGLDNFAIGGNGSTGRGDINVIINGGTIEGKIQSAGYTAAAIYWPNTGTLTINGGTIISDGAGIVQRGGTVNLNSGTTVTANGPAGFVGGVGDSNIVVGSYAVVYDKQSAYPAVDTMELNIASDVVLTGTDGDIQVLPADATGINDKRN